MAFPKSLNYGGAKVTSPRALEHPIIPFILFFEPRAAKEATVVENEKVAKEKTEFRIDGYILYNVVVDG